MVLLLCWRCCGCCWCSCGWIGGSRVSDGAVVGVGVTVVVGVGTSVAGVGVVNGENRKALVLPTYLP